MKKLIITILSLCCCISINAVSLTVSNHDKEEEVPAVLEEMRLKMAVSANTMKVGMRIHLQVRYTKS